MKSSTFLKDPERLKKLYKDFRIEIKLGKCKNHIPYSAGVKQGDNLAPTLFIIVMQFLAELLEKNGKKIKYQNFDD